MTFSLEKKKEPAEWLTLRYSEEETVNLLAEFSLISS